MSKKVKLTRRRVLGGLGTIGVAGATAGFGTSALFSDEESFEDNSITAGTLDMSVTASVEAANDYWAERLDLSEMETTADGEAVTAVQLRDVKPGDWGIVCFEVDIEENPGYVQMRAENLMSAENDYMEPEPTDGEAENDPNDPDGAGELQDFMLAEMYRSFDATADSNPPRSHLSPEGGVPVAPEGSTVQETYDEFSDGVLMRDEEGDPLVVGSSEDEATAEWCLLLYLPEDVGNVVQSDSFSLDLVFEAEQVRNNDDPFSEPAMTTTTGGT